MNIKQIKIITAALSVAHAHADAHELEGVIAAMEEFEAFAATQAPSAPVATDERAAFEAWFMKDRGFRHPPARAENWPDPEREYEGDAVESSWHGWQARAALSVKAARPELTVWYGAMPESNGKSNFTAVLMRKGEGWDGPHVTIERGEYPERIRYEADRVRHLIGEIADAPFILDYDADKHSGYIARTPPTTGEA